MSPDDIPRTWTLRLTCTCGVPIVQPDYDCTDCLRRIAEARHLLDCVKGIQF